MTPDETPHVQVFKNSKGTLTTKNNFTIQNILTGY